MEKNASFKVFAQDFRKYVQKNNIQIMRVSGVMEVFVVTPSIVRADPKSKYFISTIPNT